MDGTRREHTHTLGARNLVAFTQSRFYVNRRVVLYWLPRACYVTRRPLSGLTTSETSRHAEQLRRRGRNGFGDA